MYDALPEHYGDADFERLRALWFEDHDVLMLEHMSKAAFKKSPFADPDSIINPVNWFVPFT